MPKTFVSHPATVEPHEGVLLVRMAPEDDGLIFIISANTLRRFIDNAEAALADFEKGCGTVTRIDEAGALFETRHPEKEPQGSGAGH